MADAGGFENEDAGAAKSEKINALQYNYIKSPSILPVVL